MSAEEITPLSNLQARLDLLVLELELRWLEVGAAGMIRMENNELGSPKLTSAYALSLLHKNELSEEEMKARTVEFLRSAVEAQRLRIQELDQQSENNSPLRRLAEVFGLDEMEQKTLLYCLAAGLDPRLARFYGILQGDPMLAFPAMQLFRVLYGDSLHIQKRIREMLSPRGKLVRHRIIRILEASENVGTLPEVAPMVLDEHIAGYLLGSLRLDGRAHPYLRIESGTADLNHNAMLDDSLDDKVRNYVARCGVKERGVGLLYGPTGGNKERIAEAIANGLGANLIRLDLESLLLEPRIDARDVLFRSVREALLWNAGLLVADFHHVKQENGRIAPPAVYFLNLLKDYPIHVFLTADEKLELNLPAELESSLLEIEIPLPSVSARETIWHDALMDVSLESDVYTADELARRFKFTEGRIRSAIAFASNHAAMERGGDSPLTREDILVGCRSQSNRRLGDVAGKVETKFGWGDIVLPEEQMSKLREACNQVQHMEEVFDQWGFEKVIASGRGLNMLFSGPSGTGKTMAATIVAAELGLEMYKVDLSTVISKYIGETEKNLSRIFAEAETAHAVLFFDEADAMFGKRSEVQNANDRFANIEVGYLLQRIEEYTGIVILATNLSENIDDAFLRRLHFMIEFPMPGEQERLEIWKRAVPPETKVAPDVDFTFLARRLRLSGANIKNILLQAAFHAVKSTRTISMRDIVLGIRHEMQKESKPLLRADLGDYFDYLDSETITRTSAGPRGKGSLKAGRVPG